MSSSLPYSDVDNRVLFFSCFQTCDGHTAWIQELCGSCFGEDNGGEYG